MLVAIDCHLSLVKAKQHFDFARNSLRGRFLASGFLAFVAFDNLDRKCFGLVGSRVSLIAGSKEAVCPFALAFALCVLALYPVCWPWRNGAVKNVVDGAPRVNRKKPRFIPLKEAARMVHGWWQCLDVSFKLMPSIGKARVPQRIEVKPSKPSLRERC